MDWNVVTPISLLLYFPTCYALLVVMLIPRRGTEYRLAQASCLNHACKDFTYNATEGADSEDIGGMYRQATGITVS